MELQILTSRGGACSGAGSKQPREEGVCGCTRLRSREETAPKARKAHRCTTCISGARALGCAHMNTADCALDSC